MLIQRQRFHTHLEGKITVISSLQSSLNFNLLMSTMPENTESYLHNELQTNKKQTTDTIINKK